MSSLSHNVIVFPLKDDSHQALKTTETKIVKINYLKIRHYINDQFFILLISINSSNPSEITCSSESLSIGCEGGQVLVVKRALYGRMLPGYCCCNVVVAVKSLLL